MGEGYPMIHVSVDIKKKKIVSLEVTSEEVHDGTLLKKLVVKGYTKGYYTKKGHHHCKKGTRGCTLHGQ